MKKNSIISLLFFLALAACEARNDNNRVSYGFDIYPIFNTNCLMCHGDEKNSSANLNLSTYESLMKGDSDNGPVIVPKYPENSFLINKIASPVPAYGSRMPLGMEPLSNDEILLIERWIYFGAKDN
jgi:mono/diheme cytochrome c family protein